MRALTLAITALVVATPLRAQTVRPVSTPPVDRAAAASIDPNSRSGAAFSSILGRQQSRGLEAPAALLVDPITTWKLYPAARIPPASAMTNPSSSLSRHLLAGTGIGAVIGAAFGLAVISLADCAGSHCAGERLVGVVGHAAGGAVVGALAGGIVFLARR